MKQEGGCLCGNIRYAVHEKPSRITICHCRFCQKATGSAYMVEPIFAKSAQSLLMGVPKTYNQRSAGSGKMVHIHFCGECGTKLWLSFERFPDVIGIYAGTFDDQCWFDIDPVASKHIFLSAARGDTIVPAGLPTFCEHATTNDGTAEPVTVHDVHTQISS